MQEDRGEEPEAAGDYGYDLAHEAVEAPDVPPVDEGPPRPDETHVAGPPADQDGDYGYDLAHEVPPSP